MQHDISARKWEPHVPYGLYEARFSFLSLSPVKICGATNGLAVGLSEASLPFHSQDSFPCNHPSRKVQVCYLSDRFLRLGAGQDVDMIGNLQLGFIFYIKWSKSEKI